MSVVLLLLISLSVAVWTFSLVVSRAVSRTDALMRTAQLPDEAPEPMPVQIVFAESSGGALTVDCTLLDGYAHDGTHLAVGHPVTLRCVQPETRWFGSAVDELFRCWATEDREAELWFLRTGREMRVRFDVGDEARRTSIQLDLERAVA
jgi:hypothetical protein